MFVSIFQVLRVVRLVLHLQRVGVGLLQRDAVLVVQVLGLDEGVADGVLQAHILLDIHFTLRAHLHAVYTGVTYVHELRPYSYTGVAQRFRLLQVVDHQFGLGYRVVHRVDHREVRVAEQSELIFYHVVILRVESGYVQHAAHRSELIQLFIAQLGIESALRTDVMIRIYADAAYVFAGKFLGDRGVAVALSEAGTQESGLVYLPVQSGS